MSDDNRVTIQYAVDLSEVPNSSQLLLNESIDWLRSALAALEDVNFMDESEPFQVTAEHVDKIRKALAKSDQRIADCIAIVGGYRQTMIALSTEQPQAPEEPQHQHAEMFGGGNMADLTDQIAQLREQAQGLGGWIDEEKE